MTPRSNVHAGWMSIRSLSRLPRRQRWFGIYRRKRKRAPESSLMRAIWGSVAGVGRPGRALGGVRWPATGGTLGFCPTGSNGCSEYE